MGKLVHFPPSNPLGDLSFQTSHRVVLFLFACVLISCEVSTRVHIKMTLPPTQESMS
jgi:IS4 transposase